jgi:ketosteroid isomerase-like protein
MRIHTLFFVLVLLQTPLFAQSKTDRAILDAEQRRFDAMTRRDTVLLRTMLTEDMLYIHSNAMVETKTQHLAAIGSGKLDYRQITRENPAVRRSGKIALVYGPARAKGTNQGTAFDVNLLVTAVYRKKKGQWLLVNWQSTRVPNP